VITNFNRSTARVWCGSSNLALGDEKDKGDNLICIKDQDVATAFAIEAMRLTDHYNFRSVREPRHRTAKPTAEGARRHWRPGKQILRSG
jgi:hypothetical protein